MFRCVCVLAKQMFMTGLCMRCAHVLSKLIARARCMGVLCLGFVYLLCLEGIELAVCVLAKRCVYWVACSARAILKIVFNFVFIFAIL